MKILPVIVLKALSVVSQLNGGVVERGSLIWSADTEVVEDFLEF